MKKYILSFAILAFGFVLSCRSKEVVPTTITNPVNVDTLLLKTLSVKGASDVKIDHVKGIIQVTLPESYTSESIELAFTLGKGIILDYFGYNATKKSSSMPNITENVALDFNFQGVEPLVISLVLPDIKGTSYRVYVNQTNRKNQGEIIGIDSVNYILMSQCRLKLISFSGTIPSTPNEKPLVLLLKKTEAISYDTIHLTRYDSNKTFFGGIYLEKYYPFDNQTFTLELLSNEEKKVLIDPLKFTLTKTKAKFFTSGIGSAINFISEINKELYLTVGLFNKSNRYTLKFHNDYSNKIYQMEAKFKDRNNLITDPPSQIPAGGYLVDIFENEKLMNQDVVNFGVNKSAAAIRSVIKKWDNNFQGLAQYSMKKEQFMAGDSLLILPVNYQMICCANSYIEILRNIEAPKLRLTANSKEISITPIAKSFEIGRAHV